MRSVVIAGIDGHTPIIGFNIYSPAGTGYGPALFPGSVPAAFQLGIPAPIPSNGILPGTNTQAYNAANLNYRK
jgi:hypothetical protein